MDVTLALLADYANQTADGKLNIMGTFDTIFVEKFPAVHPQMQLILRLSANPAEVGARKKLEIKLMTEDGRQLFAISAEFGFQVRDPSLPVGQEMKTDQLIGLHNTRFESAGDYQFAILINDDTKATVPLKVRQRVQQAGPQLPR
jgi:hypothetical protein